VTYAEVDFTSDDLDAVLAAAGHERSASTLFLWSGVSMYLPGEAVDEVLGWVAGHESPRTSIVFDVLWAEALDGSRDYYGVAELRDGVAKKADEPLRWGIPEGKVEETLAGFGLRAERIVDPEEGRRAYLTRTDGTLHDRPYGFGVLIHARGDRPSS
jgi:methyltransferase (TIGR00027 family)